MVTYSLKLSINRCRWRPAYYWQPIENCQRPVQWYHRRRPYTTYHLATIPHNWHTAVRYGLSKSSEVIIFMSFERQYQTFY